MDSAVLPSSSDPPERDREVRDGVVSPGIVLVSEKEDLEKIESKKEEALKWSSVAQDKRS